MAAKGRANVCLKKMFTLAQLHKFREIFAVKKQAGRGSPSRREVRKQGTATADNEMRSLFAANYTKAKAAKYARRGARGLISLTIAILGRYFRVRDMSRSRKTKPHKAANFAGKIYQTQEKLSRYERSWDDSQL